MITRVSSGLYGGRRTGSFAGKTASSPSHPVSNLTRVYSGLYGGKQNGSFAGKTGSAGTHPVGQITRVTSGLYGGRNAGSFASKTESIVVVPVQEVFGGGGYEIVKRRKRRKPEGNVREWLIEALQDMRQEASAEIVVQVKEALQEYRKPYSEVKRYELPPISSIDLARLMLDIEALTMIEIAYRQFLDEEDDDNLLLMGF